MTATNGAGEMDCGASTALIPVEEAISRILAATTSVNESESVAVLDSLGRVLGEDVKSAIDVPGYDNSAMDGYAVNSRDCAEPGVKLTVSQRIPAGQTGVQLVTGAAARIFTGAPVPDGADAVVMQERCRRDGDDVIIDAIVKLGENIRRAGEDIEKNSVVLEAGTCIRPQEQGLMASIGCASITVRRKLRVAVFFTGDELVEPGQDLEPGHIYNSNRYTMQGMLQSTGCEIIDLGIVPDTLEATRDVLTRAAATADLVLTSGGVSVGEEDYVRIALQQLGELSMWRIKMKPGKPLAFGRVNNALFMGLPGNPVSVFVTFQVFARPLIHKMQGRANVRTSAVMMKAGFNWPGGKRQEYLRVRQIETEEGAVLELYPHQGSGVLSSAVWASGLVIAYPGQSIIEGDRVPYLPF